MMEEEGKADFIPVYFIPNLPLSIATLQVSFCGIMFVKKNLNSNIMLPTSPPGTYFYPSQAPANYGNFFPGRETHSLQTIGGETEETRANRDYHERKDKQANEMVRAYVFTNKKKEQQQLVSPLPPSGRIQFQNGVAVHVGTKQRQPDWDINYSNFGAAPLQGGVMDSVQGRMFVKDRLKARIDELNAIQSGQFTPQEPEEKTTKKEVDAASVIYQLLLEINAYLTEGIVDQKLVDLASGVLGRLYSDGHTLNVSDVSRMMDITYRLERDVRALEKVGFLPRRGMRRQPQAQANIFGQPQEDEEGEDVEPPLNVVFEEEVRIKRPFLFMLDRQLKKILAVLTTLNKNIFATEEDKRILLDALRPTINQAELKESRPIPAEIDALGAKSYEETQFLLPQPGQIAPERFTPTGQPALMTTPPALVVPRSFRQGQPAIGRRPARGRGGRMYNAGVGRYQEDPSFFF